MLKFKNVVIASDLDGTFISLNHTIPQRNIDAVKYFQENGGTFTIATGRPPVTAQHLLEDIKFDIPLIMLNGAVTYDYMAQKIVSTKGLNPKIKDFIVEIMDKFPEVGVEVFDESDFYLLKYNECSRMHFEGAKKEVKVLGFDDISTTEHWCKVNITHIDNDYLQQVEKYFMLKYSDLFHSCYSCKQFFEVNSKDARKDISLFEMTDKLGFDRKHIYTVGDNFNDIEMIRNAAKGFAPQNAEQEVKDAAFKVVSHHEDGAIADVIEYLDTIY